MDAAAARAAAGPVTAVRKGVGDVVRSTGDGLKQAGGFMAVEFDKAAIIPTEALFDTSKDLKARAAKGGIVGKLSGVGSKVTNLLGFGSAFYGMILSGMFTAPGNTAADVADRVADRIDGGEVRERSADAAADDAAAGAAVVAS